MRAVDEPRVLSATKLIGNAVRSPADDNLGKITELMIDLDTGRIAYAVLSSGGILGLGNRLFAIPWEAIGIDFVEKKFILDVDSETLKSAPGFDKDDWPDMADRRWASEVFAHFGYRPYWEAD